MSDYFTEENFIESLKIPLFFDTLYYSKMLESCGVENSHIFSRALSQALAQNIYSKTEIDMTFQEALKRSDEERREAIKRSEEGLQKTIEAIKAEIGATQKELREMESKTVNRLTLNFTIISTLLILVSTLGTSLVHYLH